MGLESASYISELVDTNPVVGDPVGEGDDHLRLIKTVLQTQFSGLSGTTAVTTSEEELNYVDGVTSAIQTQIDNFSGGLSWQAVVTTGTTMVAGKGYFVNTTGGAFAMTLPASASLGDEVHIIDYAGTFDTNNCTVDRNSHNISGAGSDLVVATERAAFKLVYVDATQGWLLTEL